MSHYTREQWQRYIKNELGEDARRKCEDHLYHCDQCLELYLEALALCEADLPDMKSAVRFTDMVMEKIGQSAGDNPWETGAGENARVTDPAKTARETEPAATIRGTPLEADSTTTIREIPLEAVPATTRETSLEKEHVSISREFPLETEHVSTIRDIPSEAAPAKTAREKTEKTPFYNRTAFHFCIAAAATWLFLVTGVFEKVAEIAATVKAPEIEEEAPSLTEELLDKTFTLIDSVNTKLEEGNE